MNATFSITQSDIARYRQLRACARNLNERIVEAIPRDAMLDIGTDIGIERDGVLCFDTEDVTSVLMDCCVYDWIEDGRNVVQRFAENWIREPGSDEDFLLHAYQMAQYRIVETEAVLPDAGVSVRDAVSGEQFFREGPNRS